MIVRVWELTTTAFVFLLAAVFVAGGQTLEAVVFAALGIFWLVGRARVPEWLGVRYLHRQASLELAKIAALGTVFLAALAAMFVGLALGWNHDPEGPVLFLALTGSMLLLSYDLERRSEHRENLLHGGNAEVATGGILDALQGFAVEHNILRDDGFGNIDHIARRLNDGEWFAIETKSGWFRAGGAGQAIGAALAVKRMRNARWVTAVVCVGKAQQPVRLHSQGNSHVWVVQRSQLAEWLPAAPSTRRPRD